MSNNLRTAKDQLEQLGYIECPVCGDYYKSGSDCACGNGGADKNQRKPAKRGTQPAKRKNKSFIQSNLKLKK